MQPSRQCGVVSKTENQGADVAIKLYLGSETVT